MTIAVTSGSALRASERAGEVDQALVWRIRRASACLLLLAAAFVQEPGRIVADTKLDLTQAPGDFLARALQLWDPIGFGGQVQNQAYGYLFPIGPLFAAGEALGIPAWVVQRLWWGVVLSVAFLGVTTLCRRLSIGTQWTGLLAGIAFAVSPRMLSTLGPVSAEAWPMALAPWVIIPLVVAARTGRFRRAAFASGVAVALMGGVNAALTLAAIVPAATYLLTRRPVADALRLAGWWVVAVTLATLWWVVPLLLLGRYSPPFLDYIETADVTTYPTSLISSLRGASHWVAYLGADLGSQWQAGFDLVTINALVFATVMVTAFGLVGLCLRGMPERGWLVGLLVVGCVLVTFGHTGPGASWFAPQEADLLDGLLAPLRNVHKFDPLIRIPAVLGLAYALAIVPRMLRRLDGGRFAAAAVGGVVVVGVAAGAAPAAVERVAPDHSFGDIPAYWSDAVSWLEQHDTGRTMLVPGSRFGVYGWGVTMDEPVQPLADVPWEVRSAIPLVPPGHIRMLDAVERQLAAGTPSKGLAAFLGRSGITHLLVRNDLDSAAARSTWPALVHQALDGSPGLRREAAFGPEVSVARGDGTFVDHGIGLAEYPAVEIYRVDEAQAPVTIAPDGDVVEVIGGPESLLDLSDSGQIAPTEPSVLAAQGRSGLRASRVALTDGLQRREVDFGSSLDNASHVLTASDPLRFDRPQADYAVTSDPKMLTVADWEGVSAVRASSSLADATAGDDLDVSAGPAAAFDGSLATSWRTVATREDPAWLEVDFDKPQALDAVTIRLPSSLTDAAAQVTVTTSAEQVDVAASGQLSLRAELSGDPVESLRVTLTPDEGSATVGISELELPGIDVRHVLVPPVMGLEQGQSAAVVLTALPGHADACVVADDVYCAEEFAHQGEEEYSINRRIEITEGRRFLLGASAAPRAGPALDRLIDGAAGATETITASSSSVNDPLGGPMAAADGDIGTGWVAGPFDSDPVIELTWPRPVEVSGLDLAWSTSLAASRPNTVTIETDDGTLRPFAVPQGGRVAMTPMTTRRLLVHFGDPSLTYDYDGRTERFAPLPVGVSELSVDGQVVGAPLLNSSKLVDLACGEGPDIVVDDRTFATKATIPVAALSRLSTVDLTVCDGDETDLGAGSHHVALAGDELWRPVRVSLTEPDWAPDMQSESTPIATRLDARGWDADVPVGTTPGLITARQNANDGWRAEADGEQVPSVDVDGWMQGYLVPAGTESIAAKFVPARAYQVALIGGLVLMIALVAGACLTARRGVSRPLRSARLRGPAGWVLVVVAATLLGGWTGLVAAGLALGVVGLCRSTRPGHVGRTYVIVAGWVAAVLLIAGALAAWPPVAADTSALRWTIQLCGLLAVMSVAVVATGWLEPKPDQQPVEKGLEHPRDQDAGGDGDDEHVAG